MILELVRVRSNETGVLGELILPNGEMIFSLEPPDNDNKPSIACIPLGSYHCKRDKTGKHQYYAVQDVPDRSAIEIHIANYYINPKTKKQELHGCIALGMQCNVANPFAVWNSRTACNLLLDVMEEQDFSLIIREPLPNENAQERIERVASLEEGSTTNESS